MLSVLGKKIAVLVLAIIVLYALVGFLLAPRIIERALQDVLQQESGLSLTLDGISLNPFTLTLSATDVTLFRPQNPPLVSIARLDVNVLAASLYTRAWRLQEIVFERPRLAIQTDARGIEDVATLLAALSAAKDRHRWVAMAEIAELAVHRGEFRLRPDPAAPAARSSGDVDFTDLEFRIQNLGGSPGDVSLATTINGSGRLKASGTHTISSSGSRSAALRVSMDDASVLSRYVDPGPGFGWTLKRLSSEATLYLPAGGPRVEANFEVEDFDLVDETTGTSVFTVATITGSGVDIDPSHATISIDLAQLDRPHLRLERRSADAPYLPSWLPDLVLDPTNAPAMVTGIAIAGGRIDYVDHVPPVPVSGRSDDIHGTITQRSAGENTAVEILLKSRLGDAGSVDIAADFLPSSPLHAASIALNLRNVTLRDFSPYFAEVTGYKVVDGSLDMTLQLALREMQMAVENRLAVRDLGLGERSSLAAAAEMPLELAVALLEDDDGLIDMRIPVMHHAIDRENGMGAVLARAFGDYVNELVKSPFKVLADVVGRPGIDLETLAFSAGSADIGDDTITKLAVVNAALKARPRLGLTVYPGYDRLTDREALARQQVRQHVRLATSARPSGDAAQAPLAFDDPKVQTVLEEFATNRLPIRERATIDERFSNRDATYYLAVFELLVENEGVSDSALTRLARYRARSIVNELVTSGADSERIRQSDTIRRSVAGDDGATVILEVWASGDAFSANQLVL